MMDLAEERSQLETYLTGNRKLLDSQRDRLLAVLRKYDCDDRQDTPYRGGLFLLANIENTGKLAQAHKLLVNPPEWSRTPGWSRICYSIAPNKFDEALLRLEEFLRKGKR
jgi:DNA-binding transcriptional MocR family regulator